jgi:hypothetical protein
LACGKQFRVVHRLPDDNLWQAYVHGKQTYTQLAVQHGVSSRTIKRHLDRVRVDTLPVRARDIVVVLDTTYFGRGFGVMVLLDAATGCALWHQYVKHETIRQYQAGLAWLGTQKFNIQAVVCDGQPGLLKSLAPIPVQMCQFHQVAIVTRHLTRKPRLEASKELKNIALQLTKLSRAAFEAHLNAWYTKWETFYNERITDPQTRKSRYVHKRLRSAFRSLKSHLPWLFTFEDFPSLGIPNTTNQLDGSFSALKNKLRNHNGLSKARRMKFIDEWLKTSHRSNIDEK